MKNREIARMFFEIADVFEMEGVQWKPNAYRKAARALESLSEPVEKIYSKGGVKALKTIPGIGEGLASKIEEYLKTGKMKEFTKVMKKVPKGVEQMMHIPGLGPKKVAVLFKKLKITSMKQLEKAAKDGKIRKLAGFGAKSEQDILRGLGIVKRGIKRKILGLALPLARDLCEVLRKVDGVKKVEVAGSNRRMKETVKDIDILVISSKPSEVMNVFTSLPEVQTILAKGSTKSSVILKDGLQADVRVLEAKSFGAALQYFTGSKDHNVTLRQIAIKKGYKLSEYGLFKKNKIIASKTEAEIYNKLGLRYIEPELRENRGEIDAAKKGKLPKLLAVKDIKGDLHNHTKWSEGLHTIEQMARAAQSRGYKYIAITDHSKSERIANGMNEKRLLQCLKEIDKVQKKVRIKILKSAEVDILPDGSLDYNDKILKKLDIVVAAIHSRFKSSRQEMTKRILKALENKHVNILAHPSGRIIHQRDPYDFDFKKVASTAAKKGIALEINAYPTRLDLKDVHARAAIDLGCKLAINTDSHATDHLRYMEFGVAQARRGWVEAKHVINTWPLKKLEKFLKR